VSSGAGIKENKFKEIVEQVAGVGYQRHADTLVKHAGLNLPDAKRTIKQLPPLVGEKARSAIVISAGPSVYKRNSIKRIAAQGFRGSVIAVDGAYIACLKAGLIPDFVLTLDPHPSRIVRWFGDHDFEKHAEADDYFARQDLDMAFRKNSIEQNQEHIKLVDQQGHLSRFIIASSAPRNVVKRLKEAKGDLYWWNPLVDDPKRPDSLTKRIYAINKLPCMATGGTVGTASWVFANSILKIPRIGLVGMDFGYYYDTPKEKTQTYYELIHHLEGDSDIDQCFMDFEFPLTKEKFYTDPTYYWYRRNFLGLLEKKTSETYNCTEAGTLFSENIQCVNLDSFLGSMRGERA